MTSTPVYPHIGRVFPANPSPATLRATYNDLRQAAISVNRSRAQIQRREREVTEALRAELRAFAQDAELALREKAKLNAIIGKYTDVIAALETAGDELVAGLGDYDGHVTMRGVHPIRRLMTAVRAFIAAWQAAKEMVAEVDDTNNGVL